MVTIYDECQDLRVRISFSVEIRYKERRKRNARKGERERERSAIGRYAQRFDLKLLFKEHPYIFPATRARKSHTDFHFC